MQSKDNIKEGLHDNLAEEAKEHVKESKLFIEKGGITKTHVTFLGKKYTHPQFKYLIKYLSRGMFMYPDEVVDLTKSKDDNKTKGFVIVNGFVEINSNNDPMFIAVTDDYKKAYDQLKYYKGVNVIDVELVNRLSNLEVISDFTNRDLVIKEINEVLNDYKKEHVCYNCNVITNKGKKLTVNDKEGVCFCRPCSKKALKKNQRVADNKLNRNDPCHCGSGLKYKRCCINKD